ncbi:hypothetical protein [Porcipelethomonas sp.]|uniref:hypothetical protein n=1 Tax=Porcipelethomonas sp. TaxID=2981675 RepID=UPI003EF3E0C1
MQEQKNEKNSDKEKNVNILSGKSLFCYLKKLLIPWLIAAVVIVAAVFGTNLVGQIINGDITTYINFGYDGVEAGLDPTGNKLDIDQLKSKDIISESLTELNIKDADVDAIYSNITVSGIVPSDVIDRITAYTPVYSSEDIVSSKNIQDTSYYPTQYSISINCRKADLSQSECEKLLNKMTEKYEEFFFDSYGYNKSLENAVRSIDYSEYDYVDAITVFDTSLESLQNYINELSEKDTIRFRSEASGYTFADLSKSIDVIRNEDLDWISSYITLHNVTKDKKNLIANYKFKIEEYGRTKKIYDEKLKSIENTINGYEKNSILIFGNATDGTNAALNQSSDTYDNLITEKVRTQTNLSATEQKISLYQERIKSLESGKSTSGSEKIVEENFSKISDKIDTLIDSVNTTATDYYEEVLFANAFKVISPASASASSIIKTAVSESEKLIVALELLAAAIYIAAATVLVFIPEESKQKISMKKNKSGKKNKKKK